MVQGVACAKDFGSGGTGDVCWSEGGRGLKEGKRGLLARRPPGCARRQIDFQQLLDHGVMLQGGFAHSFVFGTIHVIFADKN
jgi:hypothetical protein